MTRPITIWPARSGEAGVSTNLCVRSKRYWGYDTNFMAKAMSELMVRPEWIQDGLVLVAQDDRARVLPVMECRL